MNNNLTSFWIEIQNKKSGHKMLSCKINNIHYAGFLIEKEDKTKDGETYTKEIACMEPCHWEECFICYPEKKIL